VTKSDTTTVRLRVADSQRLTALAERHGTSLIDALTMVIDSQERQDFLNGLHADYQALSPKQRRALADEQQIWDRLS